MPPLDPRLHSPIWITVLLLILHEVFGILESPGQTLLAIGTCIAVDLAAGKSVTGRWPAIAGSFMTGTSVGMLVRSPEWWPFALCGAISILSKYVIRLHGRHVWNPSNFGVSFMLFVYPMHLTHLGAQWGNGTSSILMVWILGVVVLSRVQLLDISLSYVLAFLTFAYPRSLLTGDPYLTEIAPLTGPMYQLYILLMITDPRTSVSSRTGQRAMVITVAFLEAVFRSLPEALPASACVQDLAIHAPFYALFLVGPSFLTAELLRAHGWRDPGSQ